MKRKIDSVITAPLLITAVILLMRISTLLISNSINSSDNIYLIYIVIQVLVFILPCALYYQIRGRRNNDIFFLKPFRPKQTVFVIFTVLLFLSCSLLIKYVMFYLTGGSSTGSSGGITDFTIPDTLDPILVFIAFVLIPSVCEELFFRGIILNEYRGYGSFNAVLVSTVCFTMFHFNSQNFLSYITAGLIFGFVTIVTRSIYPSMIMHIINNTLALYTKDTFIKLMIQESGMYFVGFVFFVLFGILLLVVLSRAESIFYSYSDKPPEDAIPASSIKNIASVFLSPTFFLLIGVFVLITYI